MEFKDRLRSLRKERGMTQIELSKAIFDTCCAIEAYENGFSEPCIDNLIQLATYFNVSVDYLIGRTDGRR